MLQKNYDFPTFVAFFNVYDNLLKLAIRAVGALQATTSNPSPLLAKGHS